MKTLILFFFLLGSLHAQDFHIGVKAGVPLTHGATPGSTDESKRYTVGPTVEVGLWRGFSIEVDALYKRLGYTFPYSLIGENAINRGRANSWEFPMLAKYTFGSREAAMRPFAAAGGNLRRLSTSQDFSSVSGSSLLGALPHGVDLAATQAGGSVGAGVLFRRGHFGFSPEFRYTRWAETNFRTNPNQAEFLVGIRF